MKIDDLKPDPDNARRRDKKAEDNLTHSLETFGAARSVVIDKDGIVRAGNGTVEAAKAAGITKVKVIKGKPDELVVVQREDLEGQQATAYAIADNRSSELATWDEDVLKTQLDGLLGLAPWDVGFDADALGELFPEDEVPFEDIEPQLDKADELQKKWKTKEGQVWLIQGQQEHRLLCGDATKKEDVERLLGGKSVEMMFTDPPYGVNYEGGHFHSGDVNIVRKTDAIAGDSTADIYGEFLPVVMPYVDGPCYLWFAGSKALPVYQAVEDVGGVVSALLIWHKTNAKYAAMNAQYKQRHEPCLYFKPKGSTLRWVGPSDACTLWEFKRDAQNDKHPTQKPLDLPANALRNHKADTVLDAFLGSGTTMLAAEQLNRRCFGLEISPKYCAVILQRMTDAGCKCKLEHKGATNGKAKRQTKSKGRPPKGTRRRKEE
jgi:DNA modification methylase